MGTRDTGKCRDYSSEFAISSVHRQDLGEGACSRELVIALEKRTYEQNILEVRYDSTQQPRRGEPLLNRR
jgi:hypothetical protein